MELTAMVGIGAVLDICHAMTLTKGSSKINLRTGTTPKAQSTQQGALPSLNMQVQA